jgi:hypothetical protein
VHEDEKPTVSLSEEETRIFQRLLRSSRRDVEFVEFDDDQVRVKLRLTAREIHVDLEKAREMTDEDWRALYTQYPPII